MSFTYDVFISYSGLDKAWAECLAEGRDARWKHDTDVLIDAIAPRVRA